MPGDLEQGAGDQEAPSLVLNQAALRALKPFQTREGHSTEMPFGLEEPLQPQLWMRAGLALGNLSRFWKTLPRVT